ncbi:ribosomal silencing factor RsfS [Clostridia bacterium]|nr:ribosomal silencing factor RsfS [Clostridia bacterium]
MPELKTGDTIKIAADALDSKKARNIKVMKITDLTSIADYFVIAEGTSSTQVKALADEVEVKLEAAGQRPARTEGYNGANWIVLDYSDVIVHIFHEDTRRFYDLERLWDGAEIVEV